MSCTCFAICPSEHGLPCPGDRFERALDRAGRRRIARDVCMNCAATYEYDTATGITQHVCHVPTPMILDVRAFHEKMKLPHPPSPTSLAAVAIGEQRLNHLKEELIELKRAYDSGDVTNQVDALLDLVYVALGSLLNMGVSPAAVTACWRLVQEANMRKETTGDVLSHKQGIIKPAGWAPPDLETVLENETLWI